MIEFIDPLNLINYDHPRARIISHESAPNNLTPGWYWFEAEYPDEGCFGPFETYEKAREDARKNGLQVTEKITNG